MSEVWLIEGFVGGEDEGGDGGGVAVAAGGTAVGGEFGDGDVEDIFPKEKEFSLTRN